MGEHCLSYSIDNGPAGGGKPGTPAPYLAICHIHCESLQAFQVGFGLHAKAIPGDVPNYTDLVPVMQISEVVVG